MSPEPDSLHGHDADAWLERPVWVTGLTKTGTTLLLSLLDGHSRILSYPDEPSFERLFLRTHTSGLQRARDWLFGTPNPVHFGALLQERGSYPQGFHNKSWDPIPESFDPSNLDLDSLRRSIRLRGLTEADQQAAIDVESYLRTLQERLEAEPHLQPREIALTTIGHLKSSIHFSIEPHYWLFKHPLPYFRQPSFDWFFGNFARGRVVVLMRDPRGFARSLEGYRGERNLRGTSRVRRTAAFLRRLSSLDYDYLSFRGLPEHYGPDLVLIVYYEDLIRDTTATTSRIVNWLGLPFEEILTKPTKLGRPVIVPTATRGGGDQVYVQSLQRWKTELSSAKRLLIEASVSRYFDRYRDPYEPTSPICARRAAQFALGALRLVDRRGRHSSRDRLSWQSDERPQKT